MLVYLLYKCMQVGEKNAPRITLLDIPFSKIWSKMSNLVQIHKHLSYFPILELGRLHC